MMYQEALELVAYWYRRKQFYEDITGEKYERTYNDDRNYLLNISHTVLYQPKVERSSE